MDNLVKIPIKITPDPILEAVVELRFQTNFPADAIFGLMYAKLNEMFPNSYEALPILQLPEAVRLHDKNLEYAPYHKFRDDQFQINIGPKVLSVVCLSPYTGWSKYFEKIQIIVDHFEELSCITNITRIGVRYIDFFDKTNLFEHLKFRLHKFPFDIEQSSYTTTFNFEKFKTNLQVSNTDQLQINGKLFSGSIFDSDTYVEKSMPFNKSEILNTISEAHIAEKKIFYTLITDEFIKTLNPEYA